MVLPDRGRLGLFRPYGVNSLIFSYIIPSFIEVSLPYPLIALLL